MKTRGPRAVYFRFFFFFVLRARAIFWKETRRCGAMAVYEGNVWCEKPAKLWGARDDNEKKITPRRCGKRGGAVIVIIFFPRVFFLSCVRVVVFVYKYGVYSEFGEKTGLMSFSASYTSRNCVRPAFVLRSSCVRPAFRRQGLKEFNARREGRSSYFFIVIVIVVSGGARRQNSSRALL